MTISPSTAAVSGSLLRTTVEVSDTMGPIVP
jgi:hypothetical protein